MSTRDEVSAGKHRPSPSIPQVPTPSLLSSQPPQTTFSHVPRFALIHDLATGERTYAPVTYLFSGEDHPPMSTTDSKSRTLVIDLSADGDKVEDAQSLSGEWQLINAKIGTSAKIANVESDSSAANTVLNVEGLGQFTPLVKTEDVFDLARQFAERLASI